MRSRATVWFIAALFFLLLTAGVDRRAAAQGRGTVRAAHEANIIRLRQEWFYNQRAYPHKRIPPGVRLKALEYMRKMNRTQRQGLPEPSAGTSGLSSASTLASQTLDPTGEQWIPMGPQPTQWPATNPYSKTSGRVTAIAVNPLNANVVYVGTAEGGAWSTTDGGVHWEPLTDGQDSLAVGSIAVDPNTCDVNSCQTIYIGTGEEDFVSFKLDAYDGIGILKSTDGGTTWTSVPGSFQGPSGTASFAGSNIGSLAVDPENTDVVLAAAECPPSLPAPLAPCSSGIYLSTDGGQSWNPALTGTVSTEVLFDPTGSIAYAVLDDPSGSVLGKSKSKSKSKQPFQPNGVYLASSSTSFATWALNKAFPTSGRLTIALDPNNPSTLYVSPVPNPSNPNQLNVWKTQDGGASWAPFSVANYCTTQCWYDNVIAVDPSTSGVFLGGSANPSSPYYTAYILRSLNGGTDWTSINPLGSANPGPEAIHADVHAIAFASNGKMYVGSDGGVWSTTEAGTTPVSWTNLNQTFAITQFYPGMSSPPNNPGFALGGTQDNGTQVHSGSPEWTEAGPRSTGEPDICGDGGWTVIGSSWYAACVFPPGGFQGIWEFDPSTLIWNEADSGIDSNDPANFVPPLVTDPHNSEILYFGTNRVWQTLNGGNTWTQMQTSVFSSADITTIAVAPSDSNTVYAGASDGLLEYTPDASDGAAAEWSVVGGTYNGLPVRYLTQIAVDPKIATTVYATFSGFCGSGNEPCNYKGYEGHVFKTIDGGGSWTDISGNLPDTPVNDIVIDPVIQDTIYVATDIGVFESPDGGATWEAMNPCGDPDPNVSTPGCLPKVAVLSLKLDEASRTLIAGSHGRSAWELDLPAGGTASVTTLPATSVNVETATLNGSASPNGLPTTAWFEWGTDSNLSSPNTTSAQSIGSGSTVEDFSSTLDQLSPGTTYYFRAVTANSGGANKGSILSFTTVAAGAPTITTSPATAVTSGEATLNGQLNPNGSLSNGWFEYGTSSTLSTYTSTPPQSEGPDNINHAFSWSVNGLSAGTTYYYRAVGSNDTGQTAQGSIVSFVTAQGPTGVTTGTATSVTSSSAVLNGTINPAGSTGNPSFRWGTDPTLTTAYSIGAVPSLTPNFTTQSFSSTLGSNLKTNTTYYYQMVFNDNNNGTAQYGSIVSFTTLATAVTTLPPTSVTSSSAVLNGTINPAGSTGNPSFRWGTDPTLTTAYSIGAVPSLTPNFTTQSFTATLSSLSANTTYYYQMVFNDTNNGTAQYGSIVSFTTPATTAVTSPSTLGNSRRAVLNGTVNPTESSGPFFRQGTDPMLAWPSSRHSFGEAARLLISACRGHGCGPIVSLGPRSTMRIAVLKIACAAS